MSFNIVELSADASLNEICDINKSKKLILGSIIFISNLFNYNLLSYEWVKKYYLGLVKMTNDIETGLAGMYIDTLCAIISTCGKNLENESPNDFKEYFLRTLTSFSNDRKRFKPKYRFKIKDVIDKF